MQKITHTQNPLITTTGFFPNSTGMNDALNRLREKAQNEYTCIALNDMLRAEQMANKNLREVVARLNSDIVDLRQELARYREREATMGWNQS